MYTQIKVKLSETTKMNPVTVLPLKVIIVVTEPAVVAIILTIVVRIRVVGIGGVDQ